MELQQELAKVQGCVECLLRSNEANIDLPTIHTLKDKIDSFNGDREQMNKLCEELCDRETERDTYLKMFKELQNSHGVAEELSTCWQESEQLEYGESKQKALFEKAFGLRFKLTEDRAISLEFRHLYPAFPDKSCSVTLDINDQGHWEVVQVEPAVSGVQELLQELNSSADFKKFCKKIRQNFKEVTSE